MLIRCFALGALVLLSGCVMGRDYERPKTDHLPTQFKELKGWQAAQPKDDKLPGNWWEIFGDRQLNALEAQVAGKNQSLAVAEAQYRLAQHLAQSARAAYLPTAGLNTTTNRFKAASGQSVAVAGVRNLFGAVLNIAWEPDFWGSVRRQVEANVTSAQASAATLQVLRLSTQATLAQDYFQLLTLDTQKQVLDKTVVAYQKTLAMTLNRYAAGVAARSDVALAETQLAAAQAQAVDVGVQRAQMEHAIAVLIGKTPAELNLPPTTLAHEPPAVPVGVPSTLLERRPDIANAERLVASANAKIGVAKAAYFPTLTLSASNGWQTGALSNLFSTASRYWAIGPAAGALTLLDGGAHNAALKQSIDSFDASAAQYQQTVLTGFQEVEDNLSALRVLAEEGQSLNHALQTAQAALSITENQYQAGTVGYLTVLSAQTTVFSHEQSAVTVLGERFNYAVLLVKALGGGWDNSQLPNRDAATGNSRWTDALPFPVH